MTLSTSFGTLYQSVIFLAQRAANLGTVPPLSHVSQDMMYNTVKAASFRDIMPLAEALNNP